MFKYTGFSATAYFQSELLDRRQEKEYPPNFRRPRILEQTPGQAAGKRVSTEFSATTYPIVNSWTGGKKKKENGIKCRKLIRS
ncbi:hypothetical protein P5V15_015625 [Pogonomyrmex californicus]